MAVSLSDTNVSTAMSCSALSKCSRCLAQIDREYRELYSIYEEGDATDAELAAFERLEPEPADAISTSVAADGRRR